MRARKLLVAAALMALVPAGWGCSTTTSTTTTRSSTASATYPSDSEADVAPQPQSTTTTTTSTSEPDSVLGATFHLVGTIILLPFRIIGLVV
jgi:hypothetical protein